MSGSKIGGLVLTLCAAALFTGAALAQPQTEEGVDITLSGKNAQQVGSVNIRQGPRGMVLTVKVTGMSEGWHGFHIHGIGDCSDPDDGFKASGGHAVAVGGERHGFLDETNLHAGDLPNIWVGETGSGQAQFFTDRINKVTLDDHDGSAFVLHETPDDYLSEPAGDAGGRVACGVIYPMKT